MPEKQPEMRGLSTAAEREGVTDLAEAQEKGYFGTVMEDKPNSEFTVAGVTRQAQQQSSETKKKS